MTEQKPVIRWKCIRCGYENQGELAYNPLLSQPRPTAQLLPNLAGKLSVALKPFEELVEVKDSEKAVFVVKRKSAYMKEWKEINEVVRQFGGRWSSEEHQWEVPK